MGQILIRNLDDSVITALKKRAAEHSTSTEEEARRALAAGVGAGVEAWAAEADAFRARIGRLEDFDSLEILRADRARDNTLG